MNEKNMERENQKREDLKNAGRKNRERGEELLERYDFLSHSVATMECTGLQYKTATCGEECGNYKQIYDYMADTTQIR